MQKYILTLVLGGCFLSLQAQNISFSVFFEPQVSWLNSDIKTIRKDAVQFGFNTGLILDKYFSENYAFSTGVSIWNTGGSLLYTEATFFDFNYEPQTMPADAVLKYKLQYINVPLSLKLNSNQIGYISFFAHPGINTHFNIKATADMTSDSDTIESENISDAVNLFNLSYFIGAGIEYSLGGNTALIMGAYYQSGFWDITSTNDYRATLTDISIRLGIRF